MHQRASAAQVELFSNRKHAVAPRLLVHWQPFWPQFFDNVAELVLPPAAPLAVTSRPGEFWPDVFVSRPVSWKDFGRSVFVHAALLLFVFTTGKYWMFPAKVTTHDPFDHTTIAYYKVDDLLPEIKTAPAPRPRAKVPQRAQPSLAKQKIISVPAAADNSEQTIVNPPHPEILRQTQPLPDLIASAITPAPPTEALTNPRVTLPSFLIKPVQPAPDVRRTAQRTLPKVPVPQAVQPAASADDLKIKSEIKLMVARMEPNVVEPRLPLPETGLPAAPSIAQPQAVPPPPSTQGLSGGEKAAGQMMVLNLHPAPPPPEIKVPNGSRSGVFEAGPTGKVGAPGTPEISGESANKNALGANGRPGDSGNGNPMGAPAGISVTGAPPNRNAGVVVAGPAPAQPANNSSAAGPRTFPAAPSAMADLSRRTMPPYVANPERKPEDTVFAGKKYYSMQLNMPNLNSAGGSWIIRFAELKQVTQEGELSTPVVTEKVDPAYPADLMRDQVEGVVVLYAVIHADGTVGDVRVLQSLHDKLDENAVKALGRWHFRPATKNGVPVDLEAVVRIPFKPRRIGF